MRCVAVCAACLGIAVVGAGCGGEDTGDSRGTRVEGTEPGDCEDGADNDADGFVDCADPSCVSSPLCAELCAGVDCNDRNECTTDICDPADGMCSNATLDNGASCDFGGVAGVCETGQCVKVRTWGTPERVASAADLDGQSPSVAIDPNGNAVAAWGEYDGLAISIWSSRYAPGAGWSTAQPIETNEGLAQSMRVTMDPSGNAIVSWHQNHQRGRFWFNRYTPTEGWSTADLVEPGNAYGSVTMGPDGNALAMFRKSDGVRDNLWANRYTPSGGWESAELLETEDAGDALYGNIATDLNGNAVAVWSQSDGVRYNIWANRFTPLGGWGTAELIETDDVADVDRQNIPSIQVAMDESGNAVAVWSQSDGTRTNIWANRYTPAGDWGTAELIETDDSGYASGPHVAMDPDGNAVAVWAQSDGTRTNIWTNRYTPAGGWGTAEFLEVDDGEAGGPQVVMDTSGNAVAVWGQSDGVSWHIWANRYTDAGGWATPVLIQTDGAMAFAFDVAMNAEGDALAVWYAYQPTGVELWTNRYE